MPITTLEKTLKYIEINLTTFRCTINSLKYFVKIHHKHTINTFEIH
jgi:hypothetical protein